MNKKSMSAIVVSLVLAAVLSTGTVSWCLERQSATRMPVDLRATPLVPQEQKEPAFCSIFHDDEMAAWVTTGIDQGFALAVYMDPRTCPGDPIYPFRITDVHFDLVPFTDHDAWPVNLQFSIKAVSEGDECLGPDPVASLYSETFAFPAESSYYNLVGPINFSLSHPFCVWEPFFLEIMYLDQYIPPDTIPSFSMDEAVTPEDTCVNWGMVGGVYFEWLDFWSPPIPGDPIIHATGYTDAPECADLWYWKPDKPDQDAAAPSGMPDFDQNQDQWIAYCGPAAVANCLWWFDAVPEAMTPPELIELLAEYFHTQPAWGTYVDTMQMGLEQYFSDFGFALQESTFEMPKFFEMEDSLKRCQDIILLLGFWWYNEQAGEWYREGGHFVTMAGVCSESLKIAISDPDRDAAEGGWPGRVRPPEHPPHPGDPVAHNTPGFVSHDMYQSSLVNPFPSPGNPFWEIDYAWARGKFSGVNVPEKFKEMTRPAPEGSKDLWVTEVEYAVMICPKPSAVEGEEEGISRPRSFELYQNYPNPFNNETIINFHLRRSAQVILTVYNILGQKVATLVEGRLPAGPQTIGWDGKDAQGNDFSSGIYFYQLKAGEQTETKRLLLLK